MTEEEKDLIRLKNSILADQAMNALLASIGEPPDTSFIDDLKKRGIPIPDMTGYVPQPIMTDEEREVFDQMAYEEAKEAEADAIRLGLEIDNPIDDLLGRWGVLSDYKKD